MQEFFVGALHGRQHGTMSHAAQCGDWVFGCVRPALIMLMTAYTTVSGGSIKHITKYFFERFLHKNFFAKIGTERGCVHTRGV